MPLGKSELRAELKTPEKLVTDGTEILVRILQNAF